MSNTTQLALSAPSRRIDVLTSLRFFAALCICILHATNHNILPIEYSQYFDLSKAVSFFFVLSGFVLTYSYSYQKLNYLLFCRDRLARIWPSSVLSILWVLLLLPRSLFLPPHPSDWSLGIVFVIHLLLLQSLFPIPSVYFGLNAVLWSVSVEFFFYLTFPYLITLRTKLLSIILFILVLFLSVACLALSFLDINTFSSLSLDSIVSQGFVYINPLFRIPEFILGIIIGKLFLGKSLHFRALNKIYLSCTLFLPRDIFNSLIFLLLICFGLYAPIGSLPILFATLYSQISAAFFFALALYVIASSRSFITSILTFKPFVLLGEISFSIYLVHQPLMIRAAQYHGANLFGYQILPQNFFIIMSWVALISGLNYILVEKSVPRLVKKTHYARPSSR